MKKRSDVLVFEKNMAPSREKAKMLILEGRVSINGNAVKNPSQMFDESCDISVEENCLKYVSRGGFKLEKAINEFGIDLSGKTCMDIGASTGGFTDCMLQNGAEYVFSVDVGYGQFAWSLRNDKRVCLLERTNARYLTRTQISKTINFASIDVSFISLSNILPAFDSLNLSEDFSAVALIKPQFEAGRSKVGKKGVVREKQTHIEVIASIREYAERNGMFMEKLSFSPIKGPNGNIEFLCLMNKYALSSVSDENIVKTVDLSHTSLV